MCRRGRESGVGEEVRAEYSELQISDSKFQTKKPGSESNLKSNLKSNLGSEI